MTSEDKNSPEDGAAESADSSSAAAGGEKDGAAESTDSSSAASGGEQDGAADSAAAAGGEKEGAAESTEDSSAAASADSGSAAESSAPASADSGSAAESSAPASADSSSAAESSAPASADSSSAPESAATASTDKRGGGKRGAAPEPVEAERNHPSTLGARIRDDVARAAATALIGCGSYAVIEYIATLLAARDNVTFGTAIRLPFLSVALAAFVWPLAVLALAAIAVALRLLRAVGSVNAARRWEGLFYAAPTGGPRSALAPWLWAGLVTSAMYVTASSFLTFYFQHHFKEPHLVAVVLALLQVALIVVIGALTYALARGLGRLGRRLHPRLGRLNPLGSTAAAVFLLAGLVIAALKIAILAFTPLGPLVPWRKLLALGTFSAGAYVGVRILSARGSLFPASGRRRRTAITATTAAVVLVTAVSLAWIGADPSTKLLAISSSPPMSSLISFVRTANDFDRDGYGSLLGENDCAPFNPRIHPGAFDIPNNGIDEDCSGADFTFTRPPNYRPGEHLPVPPPYNRKNYNFLLITIDALRYDHTGFGGYIKKSGRDTTPNLDKYVTQSVTFNDAQAAAPGTMASVPAILTSRFYHDELALDEHVKPHMPPKLKPENVLLSEVMKRGGYFNGAILTHPYFVDWGLQQGFDTFDLSLARKFRPFGITSPPLTSKAIAWLSKYAATKKKWFLWLHYYDVHGRYQNHPDDVVYGQTEEDKYDSEIHFTDKYIGKLLHTLAHMPGGDRTVVVITADHGDGFMEHGFINHGMALYRELESVPLVIHVPNLAPRIVSGPVSGVDIFPTIADLAGIDISDLHIEGHSLVPQLFYGRNSRNRIVYCETNWPRPLRAAISDRYKLIYHLKSNVYELYNRKLDPWEHHNIANTNHRAFQRMKGILNRWLERVYYARHFDSNQVMEQRNLGKYIVRGVPHPQYPVSDVSFDSGRIQVVGVDLDHKSYRPGQAVGITVYFHVTGKPGGRYLLQTEAWPAGLSATDPVVRGMGWARSRLRVTGGGLFPTSRWDTGEYIRDRFRVHLPPSFRGAKLAIGLRMTTVKRRPVPHVGPTRPGDSSVATLAAVPLESPPPARANGAARPARMGMRRGRSGRTAP